MILTFEINGVCRKLVRNQIVGSMACISHLKFSAAHKFLLKFVYKKSVGDYVTKLEAQNRR